MVGQFRGIRTFTSLGDAKFEGIAVTYKSPSSFSGTGGNLVVMALANVLKINIVLFTSMEQMPVIPIIPRQDKKGCKYGKVGAK